MKLSEIQGEQVFDVIAEIAEPILNIALDEDAAAFFKREECPKGEDPTRFALERLKKAVPALMKNHKDDFITVLAATNGVSRDEYVEGLTMATLLGDVYEKLTDEDLLAFLS